MDCSVALRIKLVEPPDGFAFCLQKGKGAKSERLAYAIAEGKGLTFELDVDVRKSNKSGVANFVGPFAQGTPDARFFYLCAGEYSEPDEPRWLGRILLAASRISDSARSFSDSSDGLLIITHQHLRLRLKYCPLPTADRPSRRDVLRVG